MVKVTVASSFFLIKKKHKILKKVFLNVAPFDKFIESHHDLVQVGFQRSVRRKDGLHEGTVRKELKDVVNSTD